MPPGDYMGELDAPQCDRRLSRPIKRAQKFFISPPPPLSSTIAVRMGLISHVKTRILVDGGALIRATMGNSGDDWKVLVVQCRYGDKNRFQKGMRKGPLMGHFR